MRGSRGRDAQPRPAVHHGGPITEAVTHNEAIRALDAIVQLAVLDRDLAAPPGSPGEGARYIVATGPTRLVGPRGRRRRVSGRSLGLLRRGRRRRVERLGVDCAHNRRRWRRWLWYLHDIGSHVISSALTATNNAAVRFKGIDFTSSGDGLTAQSGATISSSGVFIGACPSGSHMAAYQGARIIIAHNYTIDGDTNYHIQSREGAFVFAAAVTVTISGSRSFNSAHSSIPPPPSASRSPASAITRRSAATCSSTAPARRICQAARAGSRPPEGSTHDDPRISGLHAGAVVKPGWRGRSAIVVGVSPAAMDRRGDIRSRSLFGR